MKKQCLSYSVRLINILFIFIVVLYAANALYNRPIPIFNPNFAGYDARQQLFPFYSAIYPDIFEGDYIYRYFKSYICPLHLGLGLLITKFTKNPIMTAHWIMIIQLSLAVTFLFLTVKSFASVTAALFSLVWFFQTQIGRFSGLSRSWAAVIILAFLYFISKKKHKSILVLIFCGSLLHPPSTLLIAVCYGIFLAIDYFNPVTRKVTLKPFLALLVLSPIYIAITYWAVARPADVGKMATIKEAQSIPALSKKGGRFQLVPLNDPVQELTKIPLRTFRKSIKVRYNPDTDKIILISLGFFFGIAIFFQLFTKKVIFPRELIIYLCSIIIVYFMARILAFKLFIPSRYLSLPAALFFLVTIPVIIWKVFKTKMSSELTTLLASSILVLSFIPLALLHPLNFNVSSLKFKPRGSLEDPLFSWIRNNIPKQALVAGDPNQLDGIQLYGIRRGFVSSEIAHPLYDKYRQEMERRLQISFRAIFAGDAKEFLNILDGSNIDYFVFPVKYFEVRNKKGSTRAFKLIRRNCFEPICSLVAELASRPNESFFFFQLQKQQIKNRDPWIVYHSDDAIIVDIAVLDKMVKQVIFGTNDSNNLAH